MLRKRVALLAIALALSSSALSAADTNEPIQPIPAAAPGNPTMIELGKKLYFDPRLSKSGFISCNSCHNLSLGGSDNLQTSVDHNWQKGTLNTPTVLNSSMSVAQFWDGRAKDLKTQAAGPTSKPGEMTFTHHLSVDVLQSIPQYVDEFAQAFGSRQVDIDAVTRAIAAFEETLVTPNSRFDQWLQGNKNALTAPELEGYHLFKDSGCYACHSGPAVGGSSFQKMGVVEPYKSSSTAQGRFEVTGNEDDRFNFKVPTLRNIELTYPYFHDGAVPTLTEAVDIMGRLQLGKNFTPEENAKIVAFLKTLTGDQPSLKLPLLPPSNDKTPRPRPFD